MDSYLTPKKINIAIVGLWHLGCIYATSFASKGFNVQGFDINRTVVNNLNKGIPPIFEQGLEKELKSYLNKNLTISSSTDVIKNADYIFITYDTPVDDNDVVQMKIIDQAFNMLKKYSQDDSTIIISSQIPIGSTRKLINMLKKKGIKDPKVIYFPENLRLGKAFETFLNPDRIILGSDNPDALVDFKRKFSFIKCPIITMSVESAEMSKHALNTYLATCISFSSELSDLSEKTGANMTDVVKALKTDRRVSTYAPINPGLGFAGGTLARDIQILRKIAKDKKYELKLLNAVYLVNQERLPMLLEKINSIYPSLKKKLIGILGLTYKPGTNTLRRSMSLDLASLLKDKGCEVKAFDPVIKEQISSHSFIKVCSNIDDFFQDLDMVILMIDWPEFLKLNLPKLASVMKNRTMIDTKNFLDSQMYKNNGFNYLGMGV